MWSTSTFGNGGTLPNHPTNKVVFYDRVSKHKHPLGEYTEVGYSRAVNKHTSVFTRMYGCAYPPTRTSYCRKPHIYLHHRHADAYQMYWASLCSEHCTSSVHLYMVYVVFPFRTSLFAASYTFVLTTLEKKTNSLNMPFFFSHQRQWGCSRWHFYSGVGGYYGATIEIIWAFTISQFYSWERHFVAHLSLSPKSFFIVLFTVENSSSRGRVSPPPQWPETRTETPK